MKNTTKVDGNSPPKYGAEEYLKEQEELKKEMYPKAEFSCKHCGSDWETKVSCRVHESWCPKNPNRRGYTNPAESAEKKEKVVEEKKKPIVEEKKDKVYTIEEIRELDNVINLSDEQIAKLVRGKKDER